MNFVRIELGRAWGAQLLPKQAHGLVVNPIVARGAQVFRVSMHATLPCCAGLLDFMETQMSAFLVNNGLLPVRIHLVILPLNRILFF